MPTFRLGRSVVHFAAWKDHIGLYGASSAYDTFKKELSPYEQSRGTIKFPLGRPIPYTLVAKIVRFRVNEITSVGKR